MIMPGARHFKALATHSTVKNVFMEHVIVVVPITYSLKSSVARVDNALVVVLVMILL